MYLWTLSDREWMGRIYIWMLLIGSRMTGWHCGLWVQEYWDQMYLVHNIRKCCILIGSSVCTIFNSELDNGWLYLATGTLPVSNDFPRVLYLWHRFSRVIFIYFCQDLFPLVNKLQVIQTEHRSKSLSVTQHLTSLTAVFYQ